MRKVLILFLVLVLLCGGSFVAAHALVNSQKEQVTWQEQTIYGDKSVVEGLHVVTQNSYDSSLLWNTEGTLGDTLAPQTEFYFSNQNHSSPFPTTYHGIQIYPSYAIYGLEDTEWMTDYTREQFAEITAFYEEAVETTPDGVEKAYVLDVTEYLDYYPLAGWFDLPGYASGDWNEVGGIDALLTDAARTINEYFKIPIIGQYTLEFTVDKNYDNVSTASGVTMDYSPEFNGVVTGDTCYFTFNPMAAEGQYADCSRIPGGYGIYSFRYGPDENGQVTVDLESLSTVYSLDPTEVYCQMWTSRDEQQLLLHTRKGDTLYLTVIDIATMTCLQKLELVTEPEGIYVGLRVEEDYTVIFCYDHQEIRPNTVTVFAAQADGTYTHAFTAPLDRAEFRMWDVLEYRGYDAGQLAFNGEYLAIAQNVYLMEDGYYRADTCDFYIAAYSAEGMAYAGKYCVSLTDVNHSTADFPCDPFGNYPLRIFWEE